MLNFSFFKIFKFSSGIATFFVIGFFLGLDFGYVAIFTAIFVGAIFGLSMMASKKIKNQNYRNLEMPFGPFLALGTYLTFIYGPKLINDFFAVLS